jgi:hypothetical protein
MESTIATLDTVLGRAAKLHRVLREAGLHEKALQMPIDDAEMRKRLVRFWNSGGYESTSTQKLPCDIMGKNYFGIEDAVQHFGVKPTRAQLSALAVVPFSQAELHMCKDTHILVAVFPLSIVGIRGKVERSLFYFKASSDKMHSFAKNRRVARWQLVRKTPVENSTNKTWAEQQALLGKNEEVPTAQVMTYTIIGHFLVTGERLFEKLYVGTSDVSSIGFRVRVGNFDFGGLHVDSYWDGNSDDSRGVASARKPE